MIRRRWAWSGLAALLLAACGTPSAPSGVATNPPEGSGATTSSAGTPSAAAASGVRTVLSPLGLNIRSQPATTGAVLGTAAQGAVLTVVGKTDQNGGWFKVQGQTVNGWITADPSLTASGQLQQYQSQDRQFSAWYPQTWTFQEITAAVLFHPTDGPQTIVVRNAAHLADFGPGGGTGFVGSGQQTEVVCGVTGDLNEFTHVGGPPATPTPGTAGPLALLAQIRLRLDSTHALALDFNYSAASDLDVFSAFYNSMTFPFPQCQGPTPAVPT
ncbi:MAG TPA: SH3 domain-containing protein [Candidatus Dormibacteraeota bacterium]|nr:SH3 domain-containing protein [Candidatus Dormibacteraeota bacterium]